MVTARSALVVACLSLLLLGGCGDAARTVRAADDVEVTADEKVLSVTHEAPSLLVDREDPSVVYLAEVEMQTGDCRFYVSTDAGRTWERREASPTVAPFTNCNFGSSQPQNIRTELHQSEDGTIYYGFAANDPAAGGTRSVLLARSNDRGESWQTAVVHAGPKASTPEEVEVNFEMHFAIDPDDAQRIYAMWRRSFPRVPGQESRPTRPWMAISEDGGASFGEPFMMLDKNIGFDGPRPIVVGGRLFAFYREAAPPAPSPPPPTTTTTTAPTALAPPTAPTTSPPEVTTTTTTTIPAAPEEPRLTRIFAGVSTDQGKTWEETEIAAARDASEPIPLYDREREMFYVVWHDNRNGDLDIFFSTSPDGKDWSEPRRLNDDAKGNNIGQYYPQMALNDDGRLDLGWYDYRDDPYPAPTPEEPGEPLTLGSNLGRFQSVYYTSSNDGGSTWVPNVRVNDNIINRSIGTWNGEFFVVVPVAVASRPDEALLAWSDTRKGDADTGTQDIFASPVVYESGDGSEVEGSALAAGVVGLVLGAGLAMSGAVLVLRRRGRDTAE